MGRFDGDHYLKFASLYSPPVTVFNSCGGASSCCFCLGYLIALPYFEDALLTLIDMVSEYLDKYAINYTRALFIDYTNAFNTIILKILIERLSDNDIHPNIINWTYDFQKQMLTTSKNTDKHHEVS